MNKINYYPNPSLNTNDLIDFVRHEDFSFQVTAPSVGYAQRIVETSKLVGERRDKVIDKIVDTLRISPDTHYADPVDSANFVAETARGEKVVEVRTQDDWALLIAVYGDRVRPRYKYFWDWEECSRQHFSDYVKKGWEERTDEHGYFQEGKWRAVQQ